MDTVHYATIKTSLDDGVLLVTGVEKAGHQAASGRSTTAFKRPSGTAARTVEMP
jgi:hypothetical protein